MREIDTPQNPKSRFGPYLGTIKPKLLLQKKEKSKI
jgi:hypothetical protein